MILRQYYRARLREKRTWILLGILALYLLYLFVIQGHSFVWDLSEEGQVLLFHNDYMGKKAITFLVVPLYLVYCLYSLTFFLKTPVHYRFRSHLSFCRWWYTALGLDALLYTLVLYVFLALRFLIAGKFDLFLWRGAELALSGILEFFALFMMAALFCLLAFCFRHTVLAFVIVYGILVFDYVQSILFTSQAQVYIFLENLIAYPYFYPAIVPRTLSMLGCLAALFVFLYLAADRLDTLKG